MVLLLFVTQRTLQDPCGGGKGPEAGKKRSLSFVSWHDVWFPEDIQVCLLKKKKKLGVGILSCVLSLPRRL